MATNSALALYNDVDWSVIQKVVVNGDVSGLSPQELVIHYKTLCESNGLNPSTQPFELVRLQGKLRYYATKNCTDQLRKLHNISIDTSKETQNGIHIVTAKATTPDGRTDQSIGAVPIDGLKGEALSNALMKAETKAKRRVTLSICGLGMLDESEVDSIPNATRYVERTDEQTGEVTVVHEPRAKRLPPASKPVVKPLPNDSQAAANIAKKILASVAACDSLAEHSRITAKLKTVRDTLPEQKLNEIDNRLSEKKLALESAEEQRALDAELSQVEPGEQ